MNTRKFSKRQEDMVARKIGGKRQANSGATPFQKGDVKTPQFLIECKTATTEKGSTTIKKEWIEKLASEAFAMNRPYWALSFNFGGLGNPQNFYIINENLFMEFMQYLEERDNGTD